MSVLEELLAAAKVLRDRTGDPNAWQTGLTPAEVAAVITPTTLPDRLAAVLSKIRRQHCDVFGDARPGRPPDAPVAPPDREQGDAADAIATAEAALAQQNSASSRLDMQVIAAILNAHLKTVDGKDALMRLQRETEAAVRTRSDLDTPAGARDFQRFLIGKLRDIRAVVLTASLDDTSKSALMAAWTSLYDASKGDAGSAGERGPSAATDDPGLGGDPLLESLLADDPGPLLADPLGTTPAEGAPVPAMQPLPSVGPGSLPGLGATPGSSTGWSPTGGLPIPEPHSDSNDPALADLADKLDPEDPQAPGDDETGVEDDHGEDTPTDEQGPGPEGPTSLTLPDGETVTAASPQLAAAIKAAVGGTPIAEAFQQQGMSLPAPGTAVPNPIDPPRLIAGDIGVFTDRHALALGPEKALLDGEIQHIAAVSGPDFLGWEHPPAATATVAAPAEADTPTPTRPATSSTS